MPRSLRAGILLATSTVCILLVSSACWANSEVGTLWDDPAEWAVFALVAIVVVETVTIALVAKTGWLMALAVAALANVLTSLLGIRAYAHWPFPAQTPLYGLLRTSTGALLVNVIVEAPLVVVMAWIASTTKRPKQRPRWLRKALIAAVLMNLASMPVVPLVANAAPSGKPALRCLHNVRCLALAVLTYAPDYDGALPPAASMQELKPYLRPILRQRSYHVHSPDEIRSYLQPYADSDDLFHCPARAVPWPLRSKYSHLPYTCANFSGLRLGAVVDPAATPMAWDSYPIHGGACNVVYFDGHGGGRLGLPPSALPPQTREPEHP